MTQEEVKAMVQVIKTYFPHIKIYSTPEEVLVWESEFANLNAPMTIDLIHYMCKKNNIKDININKIKDNYNKVRDYYKYVKIRENHPNQILCLDFGIMSQKREELKAIMNEQELNEYIDLHKKISTYETDLMNFAREKIKIKKMIKGS